LVDSGASSIVMPYAVAKRLHAIPEKIETRIMQLDKTNVKLIGELKDVLIRMATKPQYTQVIDIVVVDIPEAYGMLLSRDWSAKLNGYFSIDWSHILLPQKGKCDMLRVDRERYMKHVVTELNGRNEPVMFTNSILGNYSFNVCATETYFGEFHAEIAEETLIYTQLEIPSHNPTDELSCIIVYDRTNFLDSSSVDVTLDSIFWTLYFDGSNYLEGEGAGSFLIDPPGNQHLMASWLEFACTNNTTEYEGLLQGLKKAIDMEVKNLKVFGDSQISVDQVRKRIHCNSPYLVRYQLEVWSLIDSFGSFNITHIPQRKNQDVDLMASMAAKLLLDFKLKKNKCYVELIFRPSVPDNISNWQVFEDDEQILEFLDCNETFKNAVIGEREHDMLMNKREDEEKDQPNVIPKSVITMEHLYDLHDKLKKPINYKTHSSSMKYEMINLGTKEDPKNVNLGLGCSPQEKTAFVKLFKDYKDVFAWTYEDLKTFDTSAMQYVIPLEKEARPY